MNQRSSIVRKTLVTGALVTGVSIGAVGIATAATSSSTSGSSGSSNQSRPPAGAPGDPATMSHGPAACSCLRPEKPAVVSIELRPFALKEPSPYSRRRISARSLPRGFSA